MAGKVIQTNDIPWTDHSKFPGVERPIEGMTRKAVITRAMNADFSVSLVRLAPGAANDYHAHESSVEVFYVISGVGVCVMDGEEHRFVAGSCAHAPAGVPHSVRNTGSATMELLCIFSPPMD